MSDSYSNVIQEIERFLNLFTADKVDIDAGEILLNIWLGLDFDQVVIIDKTKRMELYKLYQELQPPLRFVSRLESLLASRTVVLPSGIPGKWNNRLTIRPFMTETIQLAKQLVDAHSPSQIVDMIDVLREGLINVFFRLTTYNSGAIVPIRDLTGLETAIQVRSVCYKHVNLTDELQKYRMKWTWDKIVAGILFSLYCERVQFPAPYYPKLNALERKDELNDAIRELEESYSQLFTRTGRKK